MAVAEALNPNKPNQTYVMEVLRGIIMLDSEIESTQAILNESHSELLGYFRKKVRDRLKNTLKPMK